MICLTKVEISDVLILILYYLVIIILVKVNLIKNYSNISFYISQSVQHKKITENEVFNSMLKQIFEHDAAAKIQSAFRKHGGVVQSPEQMDIQEYYMDRLVELPFIHEKSDIKNELTQSEELTQLEKLTELEAKMNLKEI